MLLYVSVVLLGEFGALPSGTTADGELHGPSGWQLVAIIWGTTVGLALAHWFAFRLAAHTFGGRPPGQDLLLVVGQIVGAAVVAVLASVPAVVLSPSRGQQVVLYVPAVLIGVVGYLVSRSGDRGRLASALFAVAALICSLAVAVVKSAIVH